MDALPKEIVSQILLFNIIDQSFTKKCMSRVWNNIINEWFDPVQTMEQLSILDLRDANLQMIYLLEKQITSIKVIIIDTLTFNHIAPILSQCKNLVHVIILTNRSFVSLVDGKILLLSVLKVTFITSVFEETSLSPLDIFPYIKNFIFPNTKIVKCFVVRSGRIVAQETMDVESGKRMLKRNRGHDKRDNKEHCENIIKAQIK